MARAAGAKPADARPAEDLRTFALKALIVLALVAGALVLFRWLHVMMLAFGAALAAVTLRALADPIRRHTPLDAAWSLAAAVLGVLAILAAAVFLVGAEVGRQLGVLQQLLPQAWAAAQTQIASIVGGEWVLNQLHQHSSELPVSGVAGFLGRWTRGSIEAVAQSVIVLVAGVYFAVQPRLYRNGLLALLPHAAQPRAAALADAVAAALRRWLLGTGLAMLAMGVLTAIGAAALGLPAPLALGLLSGLAEFVPIVGAAISAVPGLLVAAPQGLDKVLWTLAFYVAAHQFEGHVLIPLIQRRVVAAPPALTLFAVLGFGVLFGPLGVIFATPLAVVAMVVVSELHPATTPVPSDVKTSPVGARGKI